jgi:hypothetical protein
MTALYSEAMPPLRGLDIFAPSSRRVEESILLFQDFPLQHLASIDVGWSRAETGL